MKATSTLLAALLVSTFTWRAASAQYPGAAVPVGYATVGAPAPGVAAGGCTSGTCGHAHLLNHFSLQKSGCGAGGCGHAGIHGTLAGWCAALKGRLCRPYPSNAPRIGKPEFPLGFPTHPYLRSPRDYFMMDDP